MIGRLRKPLLKPDEKERKGYVPNVVLYVWRSRRTDHSLRMADHATVFATVPLDEVLAAVQQKLSWNRHKPNKRVAVPAVADSLANATSAIRRLGGRG